MKWIVFDAMGVIFEVGDDTNDLLVPYIQERVAVSRERINDLYLRASLGEMSSREFWEKVGLGDGHPRIEREYLETRLTLDAGFLPTARLLAREFSLALLSNDLKEWSAYLRGKHGLEDLFKVVVVSGEVGLRKPDPRIYGLLLEKTGAAATDCALVDDLKRNLRPAAEAGMRTVWFAREEDKEDFAPDFEVRDFAELARMAPRLFDRGSL